ncbi:MAG: molybdopterin-dependent oxidoreductase [Rhodoferax sp.]
MSRISVRFLTPALLAAALLGAVSAHALQPATGKVILTISGKVADKNTADAAQFDLAMIEKLPQQTFTTMTPWSKEPIKFTGPLLRDVLAAAKASGTTIKAMALNDYKTAIPLEDAQKYGVILAHRMNDELIPVRTKGPLFIVYPFDTKPELQSAKFYGRSAWQLKSMDIE